MQQTIQQMRARYAMQQVNELLKRVNNKELVAYASALPAMIHMNGLGQAAAFYRMKDGTHRTLYDLLSKWLCMDGKPYAGANDLLEGITSCDVHKYRLAQVEAQELMDWVKKFAKAFANRDEGKKS